MSGNKNNKILSLLSLATQHHMPSLLPLWNLKHICKFVLVTSSQQISFEAPREKILRENCANRKEQQNSNSKQVHRIPILVPNVLIWSFDFTIFGVNLKFNCLSESYDRHIEHSQRHTWYELHFSGHGKVAFSVQCSYLIRNYRLRASNRLYVIFKMIICSSERWFRFRQRRWTLIVVYE